RRGHGLRHAGRGRGPRRHHRERHGLRHLRRVFGASSLFAVSIHQKGRMGHRPLSHEADRRAPSRHYSRRQHRGHGNYIQGDTATVAGGRDRSRHRARCEPLGDSTMNAAQPKLLIVEDDDAIRTQLKYALRDQYALPFAETRTKALALVNDVRPDVVSLDLGLPPHPDTAEEGLQALEEILRAAPTTKVIVVTGNGDRANARRAAELGAVD